MTVRIIKIVQRIEVHLVSIRTHRFPIFSDGFFDKFIRNYFGRFLADDLMAAN